MTDLSTGYLGMRLRNPLVVSASPLSDRIATLRQLEECGAGAVVMRSLFEEQIEHESFDLHELLEQWTGGNSEAQDFFPALADYKTGPATYLESIEAAKRELSIPVIGSLNGVTPAGWTHYARLIQDAGADALELNIYLVAANADDTAASVEERYISLVAAIRDTVSIPLAVKIGPYFSALPEMSRKLVAAGADGLVLFNRFVQPDIDLETLSVVPRVRLSSPAELTLPLRWIAILRGQVHASLAATTGIHSAEDVLKVLLAGADVAMMASALLLNGPSHLTRVHDDLVSWLGEHEYESVEQMKGSLSQATCPDPAEFERANYMKALVSYSGAVPGVRS